MKNFVLFLFTCWVGLSWSQADLLTSELDTIKLGHHVGGKLDSVDIQFTKHSSTMVGGGKGLIENTLPINFFYHNAGGVFYRNHQEWKGMRFSALPHVGFGYVFGTQGTQYVTTNYQQAFGSKILLNIDYDANKNNGYLRNSVSNQHLIQLQLYRKANFYSFKLKSQYSRSDLNQSGGIATDSLIENFGLAFTPVLKSNAQSNYRGAKIELEHYFDFLAKDSLRDFGLYIENKLRILNHRYSETNDTLLSIYGSTNYDTVNTRDQDQLSEGINQAGLFFSTSKLSAKAGFESNYWRYSNLGNLYDTMEINFDGQIKIDLNRLVFMNHSNLNIIGAQREWFSNSSVKLLISDFELTGKAEISSLLPEQFQRYYYSNNISSMVNSPQLQYKSKIGAALTYKLNVTNEFSLKANLINVKNNYFFDNTNWRNDVQSNLDYFQIGARIKTGYKILHVSFNGMYQTGKFVPTALIQSRIAIQGRMFKGKKLLGQLGVEGSYHSGYEGLGYLPLLDAYLFLNQGTVVSPAAFNLHAFGAIEITQFRFFVRVENIGYVWNDQTSYQIQGYPVPAMNIRLGITWDFFN